MNGNPQLHGIRAAVLERLERKERHFKIAFFGAVVVEALFLALFVALADFSNRGHVLLFVAACLVYWTLALGLVALGAYVGQCTLRILKAVELLDRPPQA